MCKMSPHEGMLSLSGTSGGQIEVCCFSPVLDPSIEPGHISELGGGEGLPKPLLITPTPLPLGKSLEADDTCSHELISAALLGTQETSIETRRRLWWT